MPISSIALLANGEILQPAKIASKISSYDFIIAVDGGLRHCQKLQIKPSLLMGDFDSVTPQDLEHYNNVPKIGFPKDKDKTDLELAIEHAYALGAKKITVFGALGHRTDHMLSNINLLSLYPGVLSIETEKERLFVIDQKAQINCAIGQTISLIPLNGPATGITTVGLKWQLNNATLDKSFFGVSNIATSTQVSISVEDGDLLCCVLF